MLKKAYLTYFMALTCIDSKKNNMFTLNMADK